MLDGSFFLVEDIQPNSLNTTRMVENMVDEIDFVLHIGDISYARGFSSVVSWSDTTNRLIGYATSMQWDLFFNQIEPIATRVPYMVCIGDHERDSPDT